ncbi:ankyrin repeat-containing domain protein [Aspergillus niger]|nr:ankyrin repeat-containing domain protein [Aspergillus niger]
MLIIDALDECDSQQRTILQQSLEEMRQSCRDLVKIFVSSRYEEDIATGFRPKRTLCVTPHDTEDDLRHFIDLHVSRFVSRWAVLHSEASDKLQQLEKSLRETLNTGAQGMFLWVSLQLECISDTSRVKDLESIYEALESLPATLGRSYAAIHCRIESMKETAREVARFTFYWLLGAKRMLPIPDFLIAVARSANCLSNLQPRTIIDYCCGLVVIDNETNTFRLAHPTVREYLESLEIYRGKEVSYSIALGCLDAYLGENCVENEFLKYATNYWPSHVEDLGFAPQRAKVVPSLTEFFTKEEHFDDWLDNFELQQREGGSSWKSTNERKLDASISTPRTPLFLICCFGFVEIFEDDDVVEDLDVNQTNKDGSSGLYLAARGGHIMVVQKLLDMGASIDAPGFKYGDALQAACFEGWTGIVQLLINHGASSSVPRRGEYSSPLQAALASDNKSVAEVLLHAGVKLTTQQQFDDAIETAAFKGNVPIFQRLMAGEAGDFAPKIRPDPLQVALAGGKMRRAKLLLQSCTDINEEKGLFGNALAAAIASERLSIVQLVLDAGANIELRGRYGFPLRAAVIINNFEITKCLLEKGADPNVIDEELGDALQAAASRGSLEIMSLLLAYKAHVRGRGGYFGDTLQAAAFGGHEKAVELLIHHGAKDSLKKPRGRYHSALRAAVYAGHQSIVQRLLEAGAKLNPQELQCAWLPCSAPGALFLTALTASRDALPNVITELRGLDTLSHLGPLEITARRGSVALLDMLLVEGAQVDSSKAYSGLLENSTLALQIAAFWGHSPAVRCLLAHGVDINTAQRKTGTALQAALEGEQYLVAKLLLSKGADIDGHWMEFGSCLQVFSERGNLEAVEFLLDQGADINDAGGENGNALQVACGAGHAEIAQLLLQKGADVHAPGKAIGTALYAASANGNIRIVEMLFDHVKADHIGSNFDADINIALQAACANGHLDIVKMLLDRGIKVHDTMLCKAAENGNTGLIQLLLGRGACVNPQTKHCQSTNLEENRPIDDVYPDTTPLHLAAFNGHETAVSCLLGSGAYLHIQHPLGATGNESMYLRIIGRSMGSPLQAACYKGHAHIAKRLFVHDPWGYIEHQTFTSALQISLERSQHEVARTLLSGAIHAGFKAEQFSEIFRHSCSKGYKDFIAQILEHYSITNWSDGLLEAAEHGRAGTVDVLLSHGADMNARNGSGESAISLAINQMKMQADFKTYDFYAFDTYYGLDKDAPDYMGTLATLINAGHAFDSFLSVNMSHLVRCIVRAGRLDILTALESSGISLFKEPGTYSEALVLASSRCRAEMLRYLLSIQTTIRSEALFVQPTKNKAEALVLASSRCRAEMLRYLSSIQTTIRSEALFVQPTKNKAEAQSTLRKPLSHMSLWESEESESMTDYTEVISALTQHDAQAARLITEPFQEAMYHGHVECVQVFVDLFTKDNIHRAAICTHLVSLTLPSVKLLSFLLSQGADPDTRHFETGRTLLHRAAFRGDENAIMTILSSGPQMSLQSGEQGTALHTAVVQGFHEITKLLLESGAEVDAPCTLLGTPLAAVMAQRWYMFSNICHRRCAELLLDWGADVDRVDERLGAPIDIAYKAENDEGVELLLENGALDPQSTAYPLNTDD